MRKSPKFSPEDVERAVRMVFEAKDQYPSQWAAIESIAGKRSGGFAAQPISPRDTRWWEDGRESPTERKIEGQTPVHQPLEAEVLVEAPSGLVLGIDDERVGGDLLARFQAAIDRAANQ